METPKDEGLAAHYQAVARELDRMLGSDQHTLRARRRLRLAFAVNMARWVWHTVRGLNNITGDTGAPVADELSMLLGRAHWVEEMNPIVRRLHRGQGWVARATVGGEMSDDDRRTAIVQLITPWGRSFLVAEAVRKVTGDGTMNAEQVVSNVMLCAFLGQGEYDHEVRAAEELAKSCMTEALKVLEPPAGTAN